MPQDDPVVQRLTALGLTSYEARVYWALLRRDHSTAAELARVAGVPRSRLYDVVSRLVERGLATSRPGTTVRYAAVAPDVALDRLLDEHRSRLAGVESASAALLGTLQQTFHAGRGESNPLDYIEVLRDPVAIGTRFAELHRAVRDEVLTLARPPYVVSTVDNVEGLAVARRATMRTVYELSAFDDPEFINGVEQFVVAGEQVRFVEEVPMKLAVLDRRNVLIAMEDPVVHGSQLTTLVIEHPQLASLLRVAFDAVWAGGIDMDEARRRRAG